MKYTGVYSTIQSKTTNASITIMVWTSATGRGSLPANMMMVLSYFISLPPAQKQENLPGTQSHQVEDAAQSHMHTRLVLYNQNFLAAGLSVQQFLVLYYSFKAHSIAHGLLLPMQMLTLLQKQDDTPLFPHP